MRYAWKVLNFVLFHKPRNLTQIFLLRMIII